MVGPYLNSDKESFAYVSATKRWPAIIDQLIGDLEKHECSNESDKKVALDRLRGIREEVVGNEKIKLFPNSVSDYEVHNAEIKAYNEPRWHEAPWLISECVLYRQLQVVFDESSSLRNYDMFAAQKSSTFTKSSDAVSSLAERYVAISKQLENATAEERKEALELLFHELLSTSLWGNATDLSLLVTVSLEELKKLQVAASNRDKEMLLANDYAKVWELLRSQVGGRVDVVLDNSGFELYTDLILVLFLLETGLAEQVVLHPKSQPWFVSDVVPRDFGTVFAMLGSESDFPKQREALNHVVERLQDFFNDGSIVVRTSPFWTSPLSYWEIREGGKGGGDAVYKDLCASKLILFKGDLNYRKLTGDLMWPRDTPFETATQNIGKLPIVSLRTVKADVCVGLPKGKEEELNRKWAESHPGQPGQAWAWSGNYAVINALK